MCGSIFKKKPLDTVCSFYSKMISCQGMTFNKHVEHVKLATRQWKQNKNNYFNYKKLKKIRLLDANRKP